MFEQDAGATSSLRVRLECNGLFLVQRIGAVAIWVETS
jgi:hypothetical protein